MDGTGDGVRDDISENVVLFFFNDTATTEIYTLSLHDALPICPLKTVGVQISEIDQDRDELWRVTSEIDRKSTRPNSSHTEISYSVICLQKENWNWMYFRLSLPVA